MTLNKEDYLKEIYKIGGSGSLVINKQIASALKIAPASVSEMLVKLKREGLIEYEAYKGSRLTYNGLRAALSLVRLHRLWEVFLMRHLGYSWSEVHEEDEILEHISSSRLSSRLDKFLNYPSYCPHGNIIPHVDSHVEISTLQTLDKLLVSETSYVRKVVEKAELLSYLQELGVKIGSLVTVISIGAYEGPLILDLDGRRLQISYKAACQIYVDQVLRS